MIHEPIYCPRHESMVVDDSRLVFSIYTQQHLQRDFYFVLLWLSAFTHTHTPEAHPLSSATELGLDMSERICQCCLVSFLECSMCSHSACLEVVIRVLYSPSCGLESKTPVSYSFSMYICAYLPYRNQTQRRHQRFGQAEIPVGVRT